MSTNPIRILIADDHDLLRQGFATLFKAYPDLSLVGEAVNGTEAVERCLNLQPDVVLMDLMMPEMDGITAIKIILEQQPNIKIIVLSNVATRDLMKTAFEAGATSYLQKNGSATQLTNAIRSAVIGRRPIVIKRVIKSATSIASESHF